MSVITFLAARLRSYLIFCGFFSPIPPFRLLRFYVEKKFFAPKNVGEGGGWHPPDSPPASVYGPELTLIFLESIRNLNE